MTQRPNVFVGSSSEGVQIAKAVQRALNDVADVIVWSQGVFELNYSYLESLYKATEGADFAILVLTPDDLTHCRDQQAASPRDNVIFELGLFMGRLGRDRCFFLYDKTKDLKLPTDLLGIFAATYRPHTNDNIHASIGPACTSIEERIRTLGRRPRLLNSYLSSRLSAVNGTWKGRADQESGPDGQPFTAKIEITLDARNPQVIGTGSFSFTNSNGESVVSKYRFNGGFLFDKFLRIEYDNIDPHRIQFGSVILELEPNAEAMHGRYQGFGVESKKIVHGTLFLNKA